MAKVKVKLNAIGLDQATVTRTTDRWRATVPLLRKGVQVRMTIPDLGTFIFDTPMQPVNAIAALTKISKPGHFTAPKLPMWKDRETELQVDILLNPSTTVKTDETKRLRVYYDTIYPRGVSRIYLLPHEVLQADFIKHVRLVYGTGDRPLGDLAQLHRVCVASAWSTGKPVPQVVMAEYPDLLERYEYHRGRVCYGEFILSSKPTELDVWLKVKL